MRDLLLRIRCLFKGKEANDITPDTEEDEEDIEDEDYEYALLPTTALELSKLIKDVKELGLGLSQLSVNEIQSILESERERIRREQNCWFG